MADIRHTSEIFGIPSNQLLCNNLKNALHRNDGVFFIATLNDQLVYIKAFFHDRPRIAVDTQMLLLSVDWQAWKAWNLLNSESLEHRIDAFNNRGLLLCRQFYQPHVFMFCGMDELLETWRTGDFQSPPSCPLLPFRQSHHLSQHVSTSTFIQLSGKTMQSEDEKPLHCLLLQGKRILASIPARVLLSVPRWGFNLLPDCLLPGESNETNNQVGSFFRPSFFHKPWCLLHKRIFRATKIESNTWSKLCRAEMKASDANPSKLATDQKSGQIKAVARSLETISAFLWKLMALVYLSSFIYLFIYSFIIILIYVFTAAPLCAVRERLAKGLTKWRIHSTFNLQSACAALCLTAIYIIFCNYHSTNQQSKHGGRRPAWRIGYPPGRL